MAAVIAMLRGVNVGGNRKINMKTLATLCESLGFGDVQTYFQSGNVVFRQATRDPASAAEKLEEAIEQHFGFRPAVIVRTASDLRKAIAKNPFAGRSDVTPSKLLLVFLANPPGQKTCEQILAIPSEPEELHIHGRELYIYYPNGMARPKLPIARIEKLLQCPSTGRNWNTVNKLMAMAEGLEARE